MTVTITDVYHNGTNWVANVLTSDSKQLDLNLTDKQAEDLKNIGTPVYKG
jgi:hypothetical protein